MSSPGIRPRSNKPVAGPGGNKGPQQALRVHPDDGALCAAARSIAMPRASTELTEMLARDPLLSVRRRTAAAAVQAGEDVQPAAQSPLAPAADRDLACVVEAWPDLPRNVRAAVLAMIRETAIA